MKGQGWRFIFHPWSISLLFWAMSFIGVGAVLENRYRIASAVRGQFEGTCAKEAARLIWQVVAPACVLFLGPSVLSKWAGAGLLAFCHALKFLSVAVKCVTVLVADSASHRECISSPKT
jgi:hypothetical protein